MLVYINIIKIESEVENMSSGVNENKVPISEKTVLSVQECSALTGIGQNTLENALDEKDCPFVLKIGRKKMIIRKAFDEYIEKYREIKTKSPNDNKDAFDLCVENINGNYKVVPDRGVHSSTKTYSLFGHFMLENPNGMNIIDENTAKSNFEKIKHSTSSKDQVIYSPEDIKYDKSGEGFSTVADAMEKDWDIPLYETQKPFGIYVAEDHPSHNFVIDATQIQSKRQIVEPLIDIWSREKQPSNIVISDRKGELASDCVNRLKERGYDVKFINYISGDGNIIYNPLRSAIDAARNGDMARCAMQVELVMSIFVPDKEGSDPFHGPATRYVYKMLAYSLIGLALEREMAYKKENNVDTIEDVQVLDDIWSNVTLWDIRQLILQIAQNEYKYPDADIDAKHEIWDDEDKICGLLLFGNIAHKKVSNEDMKHLIRNNISAIKAFAGSKDMLLKFAKSMVQTVDEYLPECMFNFVNGTYSESLDVHSFIKSDKPIALFVMWSGLNSGLTPKFFSNMVKQISGEAFDYKFKDVYVDKLRGVRYIIDDVQSVISKSAHLDTDISLALSVDQAYTMVSTRDIRREYFDETLNGTTVNTVFISSSDDETADMLVKTSERANMLHDTPIIRYNDVMFLPAPQVIIASGATNAIIRSRGDAILPTAYHLYDMEHTVPFHYRGYFRKLNQKKSDFAAFIVAFIGSLKKK